MQKIIVANWKMNPSTEKEAEELFDSVKRGVGDNENVEVVICPPFVYLPLLKGMTLGAQNVFYKEEGAYTGEVSSLQLKDMGVKYVIVGHSEARAYLKETDDVVNKKIIECLSEGLTPILCIGEKAGENREEVLKKQIEKGLDRISGQDVKKVIIAYEPVWAIGTGNNCSIGETLTVVSLIKKYIHELYGKEISLPIIYGGSVNSSNSENYLKEAGVNGLLVGGDSLDADDFIKIVKSASI